MADRLQDISPSATAAFLDSLRIHERRQAFLSRIGAAQELSLDETDGLRMSLRDGTVVHLRPSGNAPEFRLYVEAGDAELASRLLCRGLEELGGELRTKTVLRSGELI